MKCRHCSAEVTLALIDLGSAPPSNAYLTEATLRAPEKWFPLRVLVCTECWLAQTEDYAGAEELFAADYAYFSSYSSTWLAHAERYVAEMTARFDLDSSSHVIEVGANDGYLLQYVKARGAHVPDINNFVAGFAYLLKPTGVATFEFPHLMKLMQENQFDTIYHEHFSYLSLAAVLRIFERNGLAVFDVDELPTHGGSLRIYAQRSDTGKRQTSEQVSRLSAVEVDAGIKTTNFYSSFQTRADRVKNDFLAFLIEAGNAGKMIAAYGAAAKGNTLLNYAGIRPDLIRFVADRNPAKQGKYLPGSRIHIVSEAHIKKERPDYVVILPWNLLDEVMTQLAYVRDWKGQFVTAVPMLTVQ